MFIYILLLFIIFICYPYTFKNVRLQNGKSLELENIYIFFISSLLIAVLGLRDLSVGIDTTNYYNIFNNIKLMNFSQAIDVEVEHGYRLFQFFVGRVFGDFQFLLIIVALLFVGVVSYYITKYSQNPLLSYVFFIVFGFYSFAMSTTRQAIAIAIVMLAFRYVIQKNKYKYLLFIFIASLFHVTALIFLPSYWFNKLKFNKKNILLSICIALIVIGFKEEMIILLNNYAKNEYNQMETGGKNLYLFMIVSISIGVVYRKALIAQCPNNKYFFYMMLAATVIMPVTQFHPAIMRLYYYFFIFMIIYVPNLLEAIDNKAIKYIGTICYVTVGIIIFFSESIYNMRLENYMFFWQ